MRLTPRKDVSSCQKGCSKMAIIDGRERAGRKIELDLRGPEGNVFCVLGTCKRIARQLDVAWEPIFTEAMCEPPNGKDGYEQVLEVMQKHFGEYIDFVR